MNTAELKKKAASLRMDVVDLIYGAGTGHIGGDLSVIDILICLYNGVMNVSPETTDDPDRDRFILSKGHSVEAYYSVLADRGFVDREELMTTFSRLGSRFIGHPNNELNGIEMNTGSLGHGLPVGVGMALAARLQGRDYRTYVVLGDGELAEGSVWEAFQSAAHYKLDNLIAVVDRNGLQISGTTEEVMASGDVGNKLRAYGWDVHEVADGNDHGQLIEAFEQCKARNGKPHAVIAHTVKGKGVSFMENKAGWHHRVPTAEEYEKAMEELKREAE